MQPENEHEKNANRKPDQRDGQHLLCGTGEPSGISEVWNGDLDELEEHLEKIEIYAEDEGMTETAKELFAAAHHIIEAFRKEE